MSAVTAPLKRTSPAPLKRSDPDPAGRRRRHLRVVEESSPRHTLAYVVTILTVLGAAIFGAVALNAMAASESVQARALETDVANAEREYAQLVADVAALENPARIREAALELGMVRNGPSRHVTVERNLPADGAVPPTELPGDGPDPLKPVLSVAP